MSRTTGAGGALTRIPKLNFCAGEVRPSRSQPGGVGERRENVSGLGRKTRGFTVGCCRPLLRGNKWIFENPLPTATVLVFLAAAARAGVVAADFRAGADGFGLFRHRRRRLADDVAGLDLRAA